MSTLLIILCGAIVMTSVYCLWSGLSHAPEGFEDESGFHFVGKVKQTPKRRAAARVRRVHAPVTAVDLHQPAA